MSIHTIDHNGFSHMCPYQPTCICSFTERAGYYLDKCPDYCHLYNPCGHKYTADEIHYDEMSGGDLEDEGQTSLTEYF